MRSPKLTARRSSPWSPCSRCSRLPGAETAPAPPRPSARSRCSASRSRSEDAAPRIRRRGAGALRDRSRLPRRRQDRRARSSMSATACSAGDVVARLDPQDLQLQVESAEAELAAATSNLAQAAADLERYTTLQGARLSPRSPTSTARRRPRTKPKAASSAPGARSTSRATSSAMPTSRPTPTASSPRRSAEPGQVVAIGQAVARLAHRGEKEAVVALPETWLGEARKSQATVRLWSDRDRSFEARLRELSPQADPATRTYAARFTIDDADDAVAFGMTATVTLSHAADAQGRAAAALGDPQPRHRAVGLRGRRVRRAGAAAGHGRLLHRGCGAGHLRRQRRRPGRDARRAEARSGPARSAPSKPAEPNREGRRHASASIFRPGRSRTGRSSCS